MAGRPTKEVYEYHQKETLDVCRAIIEEARRVNQTGNVVVITSPVDKKPLAVALAVRDAIVDQIRAKSEPPRTSSGRRFTNL